MCDSFGAVADSLRALVRDLEPSALTGDGAAGLVAVCTEIEHLGAAAKSLCARRAVECRVHERTGDRTGADWLARATGEAPGTARRLLKAAQQLDGLPTLDDAFRSGELSATQLALVAEVAAETPADQGELLDAARREGVRRLKTICERKQAARRSQLDAEAAYAEVRSGRYLRSWSEAGTFCFSGRTTPDDGARLTALLEAETTRMIENAAREGREEPAEAHRLDALLSLLQGGGGRVREVVVCQVDGTALRRGELEDGETCEVPGFGPVPLARARELLGDAILDIVVTEGVDVRTVVSNTRRRSRVLDAALRVRDEVCVVPGCDQRQGLEVHHLVPFAAQRRTCYWSVARVCARHHHMITVDGWVLSGGPGHWKWSPPPGRAAPDTG